MQIWQAIEHKNEQNFTKMDKFENLFQREEAAAAKTAGGALIYNSRRLLPTYPHYKVRFTF